MPQTGRKKVVLEWEKKGIDDFPLEYVRTFSVSQGGSCGVLYWCRTVRRKNLARIRGDEKLFSCTKIWGENELGKWGIEGGLIFLFNISHCVDPITIFVGSRPYFFLLPRIASRFSLSLVEKFEKSFSCSVTDWKFDLCLFKGADGIEKLLATDDCWFFANAIRWKKRSEPLLTILHTARLTLIVRSPFEAERDSIAMLLFTCTP